MINILVIKNKQNIMTIEATGHSGYAESGSDIVCGAVSTLMQSLANGLTEIVKISPNVVVDEELAHMHISLNDANSKEAQILMQTTLLSLKNIADSYNKYIKIKEKHYD